MLDHQIAWRDERGDFRVAKLAKQSENIPINRLLPNALARIEVTTDDRRINACVQILR